MKPRVAFSIRWKFVMAFAVSAVVAGLGVLFLISLGSNLSQFRPFSVILRTIASAFGVLPLSIVTFLIFFVALFFLLTTPTLKYIGRISQTVNNIAGGDLEARVSVESRDELGVLAGAINTMAVSLKRSRDDERNAERTKTELITSVSHDLRTPLTSVLGYLELCDQDKYRDEVELRYFVKVAYDKARDIQELIDDLFEFTQVSYGGLKLSMEAVNLGRLLEQLAEEFVPMFAKAGVEYRLSLPEGKVLVRGDPNVLVRVFENLVSNALRYGAEGKFIDIELETAEGQDGVWAVARVANYGLPIPESQLGLIFERFYRMEGSRSRETGGAGLGLAIAKNMLALHEGTIRAYNDGSRHRIVFEVRLPCDRS